MLINAIETIKQFAALVTIIDLICLTGIAFLAVWLIRTSFGTKALVDSAARQNNMPPYVPFIPLFFWLGSISLGKTIIKRFVEQVNDWQKELFDNIILCVSAMIAIAVIMILVKSSFARGLKGFGLNPKTICKDFFSAFVNLLSVWPLVLTAIIITTFAGTLIWGQDFRMQQHEELRLIQSYPQLSLRILIVFMAVIVAPLLEETLFRGLFQTMIRTLLEMRNPKFRISNAAWPAIVISSALFAMIHMDMAHWPALFVLSLSLGYAYEKSGSLFRPIFIHSLFNAATIAAVLYQ